MPMNPRLLRPVTSGFHPEAQVWRNAVIAEGGSVSQTTLKAVNDFCRSIDAAGLRGKFWRLNLFCGDSDASIIAPRVPLYRGPSRTGTQWGNATDVNSGLVQGDYTETGTGGGLNAGASKHLNTGFLPASAGLVHTDTHIAIYSRAQITSFASAVGGVGSNTNPTLQFLPFSNVAFYRSGSGGNGTNMGIENQSWSGATRSGHLVATRSGASAAAIYRNGSDLNLTTNFTNTGNWSTDAPAALLVFGRNNNGTADQMGYSVKMQAYSIGASFSAAEADSYYTVMQAFQTALGRQL
jgi:hypothetical protein